MAIKWIAFKEGSNMNVIWESSYFFSTVFIHFGVAIRKFSMDVIFRRQGMEATTTKHIPRITG